MSQALRAVVPFAVFLSAVAVAADKPPPLPTDPRKYKPPELVEPEFKADTPKEIQAYVLAFQPRRQKEYDSAIQKVRNEILKVRNVRRAPNRNKSAKIEAIKDQEASLKVAMAWVEFVARPNYVPEFLLTEKGAIGRTEGGVRIRQVAGKSSLLVEARIVEEIRDLWIDGINTEGMADGEAIRLSKPLRITGTKSYVNTFGAQRTVLASEVIDLDQYLK